MTLNAAAMAFPQLNRRSLGGVVVPIVTPVKASGRPDTGAAAALVEWLVREGVDGIFVSGTTGRFSDFTPEDNAAVCRAVVDAVGTQVTVYGGVCDSGAARMTANAHRMRDAGASVVVATGPYYLSRSSAEIEIEMLTVADRSPLPVIFYSIPEFLGYGLRTEWVQEIAKHPNVCGYKDSSNDFEHHKAVLRAFSQ